MFRLVILLGAFVALAAARRSPNAEYVEDLMKSHKGLRFSDNISEDAFLDVVSVLFLFTVSIVLPNL